MHETAGAPGVCKLITFCQYRKQCDIQVSFEKQAISFLFTFLIESFYTALEKLLKIFILYSIAE